MSRNQSQHPTVVLPRYLQIEADMLARATKRVIDSGDYINAKGIKSAVGSDAGQLAAWERAENLFSIRSEGKTLYPLFALEARPAASPRPAVASVMRIFSSKDGWRLAFWFATVNGYLDGLRPQDVLQTDPQAVIDAAQRQADGIQHG